MSHISDSDTRRFFAGVVVSNMDDVLRLPRTHNNHTTRYDTAYRAAVR